MCEALGTTPVEEEIPVGIDDLPYEVQQAMSVYNLLRDEFEYMQGNYIGKNMSNVVNIFNMVELPVEDHLTYYNILCIMDDERSKILQKKHTEPPKTPKVPKRS